MTRPTRSATARSWARPAPFHTEISRRYVMLQEPMNEATEAAIRERLGRLGYEF